MPFLSTYARAFLLSLLLVAAPAVSLAHHGPGTTGGAVSTQSGQTLKPGDFSLGLGFSFTQYESLTSSDLERGVEKVGGDDPDFDAVRWSILQTVDLSYGAGEYFQVGLSFGWYRADDVREAHIEGGEPEVHESGDVSGMTDLWLNGKYRLIGGPSGHWSLIGGVKLPVGRDDVRSDDEGERLEPSLQPGSGAFDFLLGTAYSVWLSTHVTLDASVEYTFRTENDDFRIGDRAEAGVLLGHRFTDEAGTYPQVGVFAEANVVHLLRNEEDGDGIDNSGGTFLFLSPGVWVGFTRNVSLSVSPRFPVVQDLEGEQQEVLFKVNTALSFSF